MQTYWLQTALLTGRSILLLKSLFICSIAIYLSTSVYQSCSSIEATFGVNLSVYLSNCLSFHLSIYLSTYLPIYLSIHPSIYPSIHLSIYPPFHLSIYPSIHLSIYPSIYTYLYIYIYNYFFRSAMQLGLSHMSTGAHPKVFDYLLQFWGEKTYVRKSRG